MIAYLSGPIENAYNDGADWRNDITQWLEQDLNHRVFNPVTETQSITKELNNVVENWSYESLNEVSRIAPLIKSRMKQNGII